MFRILKSIEGVSSEKITIIDSFKTKAKAQNRLDEILEGSKYLSVSGVDEKYWIEEYTSVKNGERIVDIGDLDYDFVDDFYYGRAIVRDGDSIGIINEEFQEILECDKYSSIGHYKFSEEFDEPVAIVHYNEDNHVCLIDLDGNFIVKAGANLFYGWQKGHFCRIPSKGIFIAYCSDSKWVLIKLYPDRPNYDPYIGEFHSEPGQYTFYDTERRRFMIYGGNPGPEGTAEFSDYPYAATGPFSGDVAIIERNNRRGLINSDEMILVEPKYECIQQFSEGLAAFKTVTENKIIRDPIGKIKTVTLPGGGKWGFINKLGKEVIPAKFDDASRFYSGNAAVKIGQKWGFINSKGELIISPMYDSFIGIFVGGVSIVTLNGKYGLLSANLKEQTGTIYSYIEFDCFHGNDRFDEPCFRAFVGGYFDGYGVPDYDELFYIVYKGGLFHMTREE